MLNICSMYGESHNIAFYANKTVCLVVGKYDGQKPSMYINEQVINWVNQLKYLGVMFNVGSRLSVDAKH